MNDPQAILAGLHVVELATYVFAPASATVLSDFGADVIKVERPGIGDVYRYLHAVYPNPRCDMNYLWLLESRNKRSVALNVASAAGRDALLKLVAKADVFITNYQPSVLAKLRLSYEEVSPLNERLIYAHATGYGEAGELAEKPGYDMTAYWARSGMMDGLHYADSDPCPSLIGMGDHPSSISLFAGIMLALFGRDRSGRGTKVSCSLLANGLWANGCQIQAAICGAEFFPRSTRASSANPMINHYLTRDGRRIILCLIQPERDWPNLCRALGRPELIEDPRFADKDARSKNACQLIAILDEVLASQDQSAWTRLFANHDVTWSPVPTIEEVADDPDLIASGFFAEVEHPGHGRLRLVDSPIQLRDAAKVKPRPAPTLGQHTREVLRDLGYDEQAIQTLIDEGAAG